MFSIFVSRNISDKLQELLLQGCEKKFSTCPKECFKKNILFLFEKLCIVFFSGFEHFFPSYPEEKIPARLSKLHPTCPDWHL